MIRERRHRLSPEAYRGFVAVVFTTCVKDRFPFFTSEELFKEFETMLLRAFVESNCSSDAYLFMPDHAHVIIRGQSEQSDCLQAMRLFKQYSGFWLSKNSPAVHWQKDYYDHILRNDRAIERHIRYILNNPVRAGLANHWKDYALKGSTLHQLDSWD